MNTTPINVLSAAIGALALSLVLVSTGATAPQGVAQAVTTQRVFIENVRDIDSNPNPRNAVVIRQGTPYVVPAGRLLVVTALGAWTPSGNGDHFIELVVDGVFEVTATGRVTNGTGA